LIDIGLYEGLKGLDYLRHTSIIEDTDKYVHYDEKVEMAKEGTVKLYRFISDKIVNPVKENIIVMYD